MFSVVDLDCKALYSIIIFFLSKNLFSVLLPKYLLIFLIFALWPVKPKIFTVCPLQKNFADPCVTWAWGFETLRMRGGRWVKKVEIVWALGDDSIRAGLGVRKFEGDLVPQYLWFYWNCPDAWVMAAAQIYLQAVLHWMFIIVCMSCISSFIVSFLIPFFCVMKRFSVL